MLYQLFKQDLAGTWKKFLFLAAALLALLLFLIVKKSGENYRPSLEGVYLAVHALLFLIASAALFLLSAQHYRKNLFAAQQPQNSLKAPAGYILTAKVLSSLLWLNIMLVLFLIPLFFGFRQFFSQNYDLFASFTPLFGAVVWLSLQIPATEMLLILFAALTLPHAIPKIRRINFIVSPVSALLFLYLQYRIADWTARSIRLDFFAAGAYGSLNPFSPLIKMFPEFGKVSVFYISISEILLCLLLTTLLYMAAQKLLEKYCGEKKTGKTLLRKHPCICSFYLLLTLFVLIAWPLDIYKTDRSEKELESLRQRALEQRIALSPEEITAPAASAAKENGMVLYREAVDILLKASEPFPCEAAGMLHGSGHLSLKTLEIPDGSLREAVLSVEKMEPLFQQIRRGNAKNYFAIPLRKERFPFRFLIYELPSYYYDIPAEYYDPAVLDRLYNWYQLKIYLELQTGRVSQAYEIFLECLTFTRNYFTNQTFPDGGKPAGALIREMVYLRMLNENLRWMVQQYPPENQKAGERIARILDSYGSALQKSMETDLVLALREYGRPYTYTSVKTGFVYDVYFPGQTPHTGTDLKSENLKPLYKNRLQADLITQYLLNKTYLETKTEESADRAERFGKQLPADRQRVLNLLSRPYIDGIDKILNDWQDTLQEMKTSKKEERNDALFPQI